MAIEKLMRVPIMMYSVFLCVESLCKSPNRNTDLAASKKPIALIWFMAMNVKIKKRSIIPIHLPASFRPLLPLTIPVSLLHFRVILPIKTADGVLNKRYARDNRQNF